MATTTLRSNSSRLLYLGIYERSGVFCPGTCCAWNTMEVLFPLIYQTVRRNLGAKYYWDFRISDLVKNPDGTDI